MDLRFAEYKKFKAKVDDGDTLITLFFKTEFDEASSKGDSR